MLIDALENNSALCHPFVVGELACGYLPSRPSTIRWLRTLPEAPLLRHDEVLTLIERHQLMSSGIGWIDAHLVGSVLLAKAELWTLDQALTACTRKLGLSPRTARGGT